MTARRQKFAQFEQLNFESALTIAADSERFPEGSLAQQWVTAVLKRAARKEQPQRAA
jgi:hypothetical protein